MRPWQGSCPLWRGSLTITGAGAFAGTYGLSPVQGIHEQDASHCRAGHRTAVLAGEAHCSVDRIVHDRPDTR